MHTRKTFCRFCHANCAIEVDIDGDRAVAVRGDVSDPLFGGYTCMKGRELPAQANHPERLRSSQRRLPDGAFAAISSGDALDEIAGRLAAIRDRHGPRAIATYCGTYGFMNSAALPVALGFHHGLGSPSFYTSITIDQPAKVYLGSRVGAWLGGPQPFSRADVSMMIGNNPLTSHYAWQGSVPPFSPSRRLRDAKARGLKLICVDPRRTMVAQLADIHLQVRPGEDATLLAGMLRLILEEELHDREFCERHVTGLAELHRAIIEFHAGVCRAPLGRARSRPDRRGASLRAGPQGRGHHRDRRGDGDARQSHRASRAGAQHRVRPVLPRRRGSRPIHGCCPRRRRARLRCSRPRPCGAKDSRNPGFVASRNSGSRCRRRRSPTKSSRPATARCGH
jgi:anaerobic selenocysteine-containing dehydrogenase